MTLSTVSGWHLWSSQYQFGSITNVTRLCNQITIYPRIHVNDTSSWDHSPFQQGIQGNWYTTIATNLLWPSRTLLGLVQLIPMYHMRIKHAICLSIIIVLLIDEFNSFTQYNACWDMNLGAAYTSVRRRTWPSLCLTTLLGYIFLRCHLGYLMMIERVN